MQPLGFWRTTIGKKVVMAVTGVIMILFLVAHLAGNLLVFAGARIAQHRSQETASIHAIAGQIRLGLPTRTVDLPRAGVLVSKP